MDRRKPAKTDWSRLEHASLEADRAQLRETSPGRRVEQQIELSRELTRLAARRARQRR